MTTISRKLRTALVISTLALTAAGALGGCAKKDDQSGGVVSVDPNANVSGAKPGEGDSKGGDVAAFGKCMRDAGFSWWPDPDNSGRINATPPAGVQVDEEKLSQAQQDCSSKYMNPGQAPAMSAEDIETLKGYSKCMRDNGLANFPDPDANGNIDLSGAKIQDNTPEWKKASEACQKFMLQPKDRQNGSTS
jgi:hypothetical protein